MKSHAFVPALLAASLGLGGLAFAQGDGDLAAQEEARRQVNRSVRQQLREQGYLLGGQHQRDHDRDWVAPEYRGRNYAVDDWRQHGLSAPPRGYHWVQLGRDYVLVANDSGAVRQWWPRR